MSFQTIPLEDWGKIHNYQKFGWLYRGQRCARWGLQTALERYCDREKIEYTARPNIEHKMFREFRRAYHRYSAYLPDQKDALEWFSWMQHYGVPTRLLDFTYSIYVAAYFALENAEKDCAIMAVNGHWALHSSIDAFESKGRKGAPKLKELYDESHILVFGDMFLTEPAVPCACPQNPFRLNDRLRTQKGVFLAPGSITIPFEDNLRAMKGHDDEKNVLKLVIPHAFRALALRHLFEMNISNTSLFPGLDGFARSLGVYHPGTELRTWSEIR